MARTVDPVKAAARREVFLDAAEALLRSHGYERMSVADVLAATGASKGAFYHYFQAKGDLVAAVMDRMSERIGSAVSAAAGGEGPPPDRLQACFDALAQWKGDRPEILGALVRVWQSDANAVVRQWLRPRITDRLGPVLEAVIIDGRASGDFDAPAGSGRVVVGLVQDLNDRLAALLTAGAPGAFNEAVAAVAAYTAAIERVLGLPARTLSLVEPQALRPWFPEPEGPPP
jgi:AcrR family transcriptional regulator